MNRLVVFLTLFLLVFSLNANAGGSPSEAYQGYLYALQTENVEALKLYSTKEGLKKFEEAGETIDASTWKMMKATIPQNLKIISERIEGDKAYLEVEGFVFFSESVGTIELIKEDGSWKMGPANWKSKQ